MAGGERLATPALVRRRHFPPRLQPDRLPPLARVHCLEEARARPLPSECRGGRRGREGEMWWVNCETLAPPRISIIVHFTFDLLVVGATRRCASGRQTAGQPCQGKALTCARTFSGAGTRPPQRYPNPNPNPNPNPTPTSRNTATAEGYDCTRPRRFGPSGDGGKVDEPSPSHPLPRQLPHSLSPSRTQGRLPRRDAAGRRAVLHAVDRVPA